MTDIQRHIIALERAIEQLRQARQAIQRLTAERDELRARLHAMEKAHETTPQV